MFYFPNYNCSLIVFHRNEKARLCVCVCVCVFVCMAVYRTVLTYRFGGMVSCGCYQSIQSQSITPLSRCCYAMWPLSYASSWIFPFSGFMRFEVCSKQYHTVVPFIIDKKAPTTALELDRNRNRMERVSIIVRPSASMAKTEQNNSDRNRIGRAISTRG